MPQAILFLLAIILLSKSNIIALWEQYYCFVGAILLLGAIILLRPIFLDVHFAFFCFEHFFANICRRFTGTSAINQESLPVAHVEFNNSDTRCARVSACHLYAHALRALRACAPCVCPLRAVCVSARFASRLAASSWAHQTRRPL